MPDGGLYPEIPSNRVNGGNSLHKSNEYVTDNAMSSRLEMTDELKREIENAHASYEAAKAPGLRLLDRLCLVVSGMIPGAVMIAAGLRKDDFGLISSGAALLMLLGTIGIGSAAAVPRDYLRRIGSYISHRKHYGPTTNSP